MLVRKDRKTDLPSSDLISLCVDETLVRLRRLDIVWFLAGFETALCHVANELVRNLAQDSLG